jgi:hypothetical protein
VASAINAVDTMLQNALAASQLSDEATGHIRLADETGHFDESTNAIELLHHVFETTDGQVGILRETKEALLIAHARLDEAVLSLRQVHASADEVILSTGGALENLDQLAQRLG